MAENWPPKGYLQPMEYEVNKYHIYGLAVILSVIFGVATIIPILEGVDSYLNIWKSVTDTIGLAESSIIYAIGGVFVACISLYLIWKLVLLPIHEGLHYFVGLSLGLNPDFGYEEGILIDNPRVVALTTGISVWENLAMIIAPFVVIGVLSLLILNIMSGIIAGLAAFILLANSAASCQDMYHYLRLIRMDPGTEFANFEDDGTILTEYAIPKK